MQLSATMKLRHLGTHAELGFADQIPVNRVAPARVEKVEDHTPGIGILLAMLSRIQCASSHSIGSTEWPWMKTSK